MSLETNQMVLSNLKDLKREKTGIYSTMWRYTASVDVTTTTGCLWWKKKTTIRRNCAKDQISYYWFFTDDGKFTPGHQMEALVRAGAHEAGWLDL